ncbi:MAG: class II fumarate hydratase [Gemmatimonadetes bacterium]|uniref:Fumarate hydratase class II n=1 Tax=Candidatus Kutchimonas denitrificans TaxID=3056748 RepID=A0AAE4ZCE9_9BACT|nr:class II fumarate hydratase [Gemmatimonadota bacterium]NIR75911.1 class II fumarate hydratase [Candidatus Kutchimonas denitrificans]NIS02072.1 class II fumarate hydratase [Gemmatimonadota bacterium]NIT67878.1 class II fumarate hydratase [Gemmatimonadota bacterium]NIU53857.1 aspartate ammonia-lyase [Gemmatimonadota bacterium]
MGSKGDYRIERDTLGEMKVPADALYGAQTQRAVENFPVSDLRFPRRFIKALGGIKMIAARVNMELEVVDEKKGKAIEQAAKEVMEGKLDEQFVVDIFQTGSGTSTNMNANEVIANRATQILGGEIGSKDVHPNDHVNAGQSSNDVIPTAAHVAACTALIEETLPGLGKLRDALAAKADEFADVVKTGRTHLMDATPVTLGQEFSGYASQIAHGITRVRNALPHLSELAIGGTAVGTGINAHPKFAPKVCAGLSKLFDHAFVEAPNHFEAQAARDALVEASGALRTVAVSMSKIANDIRWLASGPRTGLSEISIPATQPGSSIMPGKVNPVIAESVRQVCAQVMGNDVTIVVAGQFDNFELAVMIPIMTYDLLQSASILGNAATILAEKCVAGTEANRERCLDYAERSPALATVLAPKLGYDKAAELAKKALELDVTVRELVVQEGLMDDKEAAEVLDPAKMTNT